MLAGSLAPAYGVCVHVLLHTVPAGVQLLCAQTLDMARRQARRGFTAMIDAS